MKTQVKIAVLKAQNWNRNCNNGAKKILNQASVDVNFATAEFQIPLNTGSDNYV